MIYDPDTLMFIMLDSASYNGNETEFSVIFSFQRDQWAHLATLVIAEDNHNEDWPQWLWAGTLHILKTKRDGYPDLMVTRKGFIKLWEPVPRLVKANDCHYHYDPSYSGGRSGHYSLSKGTSCDW